VDETTFHVRRKPHVRRALQVRSGKVKKSENYAAEILMGEWSQAGEEPGSLVYSSDAMGYENIVNGSNEETARGAFALGFRLSLPVGLV